MGNAIDDACLRSCTRLTAGLVHIDRGAVDETLAACREALAFGPEPFSRVTALGQVGYALLLSGPDRYEAAPRPAQVCAGLVRAAELLVPSCSPPAGDPERILRLHLVDRVDVALRRR